MQPLRETKRDQRPDVFSIMKSIGSRGSCYSLVDLARVKSERFSVTKARETVTVYFIANAAGAVRVTFDLFCGLDFKVSESEGRSMRLGVRRTRSFALCPATARDRAVYACT
jgi:hypothetical protein